ncbi:MAG TPA: hypothetical protein VM715_19795 [Candidatus Acidoferrum sp.]|jgi:hypothetical protein|nr:hypothetical protein [Candidatus Acidoferrum sp.]
MQQETSFLCSICFVPINLSQCKTDEGGRPVHAECQATRDVYLATRQRTGRNKPKYEWLSIWSKRKIE